MALPVVPSPITWSSGELVYAEYLRSDVSNAVQFLSQRPVFAGQDATGGSVGPGAGTLGTAVELYDTWNGHNDANLDQYYCQAPGWYLCRSAIPYAYTGSTQYVFISGFSGVTGGVGFPNVYGGLLLNGSAHVPVAQCCDLIPQHVTGAIGGSGDYIQFNLYAGVATTLVTAATQLPTVSVRWVAAISGTAGLPVPVNPSWPVPPSYITDTGMNASVRDTINFLTYPPVLKAVYQPGTATLPSTTFPAGTAINFGTNAVIVDNYSGFGGGTAGYTAPVAGNYFCYGQVNLAANANSTGYCAGFSVNTGTTQWGDAVYKVSDSIGGGATVTKRLRLSAGDQVQLVGCQGSGGAIEYNATAANATKMVICWEGA